MSLVVAYKRDGVVYMGADSQSTTGSAINRSLNDSGFKVTRLANGMLIGVCGRVKGHQKIVAQKHWFNVPEGETFDKRYIVNNIIPELSVLMQDICDDRDARSASMSVQIIIAYNDKLFVIGRHFDVYECNSYVAIGAGDDYTRYCLSQIGPSDDVNACLLEALKTGAYFDSTVSAPYILIDTKDKQYTIVEG